MKQTTVIQIQHLLKLNITQVRSPMHLVYSNTTLVKVKSYYDNGKYNCDINSNTTLVKVKWAYCAPVINY